MQGKRYAGIKAAIFSVLCPLLLLTGCGEGESSAQITNLQIDKNGKVTSNIVEDFGKDFYTVESLEAMMQEEINAYNLSHPDAILLKKAELSGTEEGKILVTMEYASCEDYMDFNGVELFYGTVTEAQAAGFDLNVKLIGASKSTETVGQSDILGMKDARILIIRQSAQVSQVSLPGKVLYMTEGTGLVDSKTISLPGPDNEADIAWKGELTYVILK